MTDDKKRKYYESLVRAGVVPAELTYELFLPKIQNEKGYADIVYSGLKTAQKLNIVNGVPDENEFKRTLGVGSLTPREIERVASGQTPRNEQMGPIGAPDLPTANDEPTAPQQAPEASSTELPKMQDGTQMPTGGGLGQGQFEITDTTQQQQQAHALPPVQQVQAQTTATGSSGVPSGVEAQTGIPYMDALANAVQRGYNRGEIADYITAMGKTPDGTELKKIAEITKANDKLATSEYMKQFSEDPSISTTILSLPEIAIESIASLYRHGLARMGAGAAAGAGVGSVVPGVGTAIGAGTGALAGMSVAGLGVEVSSTILDSFRELGVDITNEKALEVAFKNPQIMGYAKNMAYSRGIPIAVFDAVSMGVAGKILGKPASTVARRIGQVVGEAGIQGSLGAAGEASAQAISGQEFKPYEILAEGLAEIPGSVPEVGIAMIGKRKASGADTKLDVNKLAVDNPDMPANVVSEIIDVSVGTGELSGQQADEIKADFAKAQEINATIPEDIKEQGSRITAIGIIEERNNLTAKLETVDEAFKPQIQEKIKALNQQLQELGTIGLTPEAQTFFDSNEASLTNPIATMPAEVETTLDKITNGILISDKGLHDAYQWVTGSVKATLENQTLSPAEKGATLNILNGMLSDIDKANTEGQKFVEEVETASVQGRVPAVREGVATLPKGQQPGTKPETPALDQAKQIREENKRKQAGTTTLPSSGQTIITPAPATTEVATEEVVTETPAVTEQATEQAQQTPTEDAVQVKATTEANPALADVESTAKALDGVDKDPITKNINGVPLPHLEIDGYKRKPTEQYSINDANSISEAYHKAKQDGSNPELVKAVEALLAPETKTDVKTETQTTPQTETTETVATANETVGQEGGQVKAETEVKPVKKTYEVFRGQDEDYEVGEYDGTYGKGVYYTGNKKSAKVYGKNVTSHKVELSNPFIIKGTRVQGVSLEGMKDYINENVIPKGHDGVIILDGDGNIFELVKFDTQKSKTDTKPTPEAKPKSAMEQAREARRQAQAQAKAKQQPTWEQRAKAREAHFKPGAIIEMDDRSRDKVIEYNQDPNDPNKWSVTVQQVDAKGNPIGPERTHKTEPSDKEYKRSGVEVVAGTDPNAEKKAKIEELKARNKELDEEFMKGMGKLTANLNPKQVAIIAEKAWNKLQEIAINADMSATAVATRIKRAIDEAIAEINAMVEATGNSALIPDKDDIANIVNAVRKLAYPKGDMGKIGESDGTPESAPQIGAPIYTDSQIDISRRKVKKLKEGKMEPDTKDSLLAKARKGIAMIRQAVDSPRAMLNYAESKLETLTGFKASRDIPIGRAMEQMRNRARQKALPYFERLSDALTPVKDNIEDFEDYLIYRRIIDRNVQDQKNKAGSPAVDEGQQGIVPAKGAPIGVEAKPETETGEKASRATGGMTIIDADIALNDMAQRLGEDKMEAFREAGDKIQEIMDDNLKDMVDAGILTQERYEAIKEQNEFYVPFDVIHRDFQGNILSGKAVDGVLQPSGKVLEKIKGIPAPKTLKGIDDAIDVFHSLMKSEDIDADQFYFLSMEYLNKALSSGMITQAEYEAKVDALSEPGFELNSPLNKISKILAAAQYSVVRQEYMEDIDKMVEADKDNVFFLKLEDNVGAPQGYEVISYYKNGEKIRVAVDRSMKEAIDGATPTERNIIQKFFAEGLNKIATPFKLSATALSTSFLPANFVIDVMRTLSSQAGLFSGATTAERALSPIQIPVMYAEAIATSMIGNITMSPLGKKLGIDKFTPRLFMDWYNSGSYSEGSFLGTISEGVDGIISPESAKEKKFMKEMTKNMKLVFNEDRAKEVAKALKDTKKVSKITSKSIMDVMLLAGKIMENSHKIYGHAKLSGTELGTRMGLDRYMGGIIDKATNRNTLLTQAQKERAVERVNDEVLNMVGSPNFAEIPPFMRSMGLFFPFIGAASKGNMTDLTRLTGQEGGKKGGRKAMAYAVRNATMFVAPAFMTALYYGLLDDDDEEKKFYDEIDEKTKVRNQIYTVERENPDGTKYFDAVTLPLRSIPVVMNSIGEGMGRSMAMAIKGTLSAKELASISKDAIFNSMSEMSVVNFSDKASYTGERDAVTGEKITRRQDEEWINRTGSLMSGLNPILKYPIEKVANRSLYGKYNLVPNKLKGLQMAIINEDIDPATNKPYSPSELYTRFTPDYAIELSKNFEKMGVRITPITIDNFFDTFLASSPERLDVNPVDALKQRLIWSEKKKRYEAQSGVSTKAPTANP